MIMTSMLSTVMKSGRAAIVAVTLGAAAITALPVQAQSFSFEFGIRGGGNTFSFGIDDGRRFRRACLTNNEIRRGLRRNGFEDIRFLSRRGVRVQVYAEWGRRAYILTINRCNGRVVDVDRVRRRGGGGGPSFEFNFGGGGMSY
jgi:hypothetical protein